MQLAPNLVDVPLADLPARSEAERDRLYAQVQRLRSAAKRAQTESDRLTRELDEATRARERLEGQAEQVFVDEPRRRHPSDRRGYAEAHWEPDIYSLPLTKRLRHAELSEEVETLDERLTGANRKLASAEHELEKAEQALMLAERWLGEGLAMVGAAVDAAAERQQVEAEETRLTDELAAATIRRERADKNWENFEYRLIQVGGKPYLHDILDAAQQQKDRMI